MLMSIAETVDEWEKGIQAFEAVATCPVGTFASLREHLRNHRCLVLDLGPATFDKVLFDFRVRSPTYAVDAASSSTSVASPSSALPRTLPGRLMPGKRRKITSSTSSHPNSTSLRHSVLHQHECVCETSGFGDLVFFDLELPLTLNCKICRYCQVRMYLS